MGRWSTPPSKGGKYDTALQVACEFGHEAVVRLLIRSGAEINARGGGYGYALQAAAAKGQYAVSALLLEQGAEVNVQGGIYGSALQAAANIGSEKVARLLLDAGGDPNIQGGGFRDALRAAAWRQEQSIFDLLLERGADVEVCVRQLERTSTTEDDKDLVDSIYAARAASDPRLMDLIYKAAQRTASIEHEEYTMRRVVDKMMSIQPNRNRLRKAVQYILRQDSARYQEASIPSTWLTTANN